MSSLIQLPVLSQRLIISQVLFVGDTCGDIPLYSLHRISKRLTAATVGVNHELIKKVIKEIIDANLRFQERTEKKWNCLTSNDLDLAILTLDQSLTETINDIFGDQPKTITDKLNENRQDCLKRIRNFFYNNYDNLLYDAKGKVPWVVVRMLHRKLKVWTLGTVNPFDENLIDFFQEIATEQKIDISGLDDEDVWSKLNDLKAIIKR